jgi:hypothetical protein
MSSVFVESLIFEKKGLMGTDGGWWGLRGEVRREKGRLQAEKMGFDWRGDGGESCELSFSEVDIGMDCVWKIHGCV